MNYVTSTFDVIIPAGSQCNTILSVHFSRFAGGTPVRALQTIIDAHQAAQPTRPINEMPEQPINEMPDLPVLDQMWMMLQDNVRIMKEMILQMQSR
jgi:hypothetical protein